MIFKKGKPSYFRKPSNLTATKVQTMAYSEADLKNLMKVAEVWARRRRDELSPCLENVVSEIIKKM